MYVVVLASHQRKENMEEADQNSVYDEVAPQYAETDAPAEQQDNQENDHRHEVDQDRNWKAVRERLSALEAENRRKDELLEKALTLQAPKSTHVEPEEPEEPDDEYINKGGVKKVTQKYLKPFEQKIEELEKQLAAQRQKEMFQDLRSRYKDFDEYVNAETIALLEEREPELANTIAEIKDPVKMGIQTYKYVKALNLTDDVPKRRHQKESEKKLEQNAKTVQSPQAFDKRPMAQAFQMSQAEKTKLYEEMMGAASMVSTVPPMM